MKYLNMALIIVGILIEKDQIYRKNYSHEPLHCKEYTSHVCGYIEIISYHDNDHNGGTWGCRNGEGGKSGKDSEKKWIWVLIKYQKRQNKGNISGDLVTPMIEL